MTTKHREGAEMQLLCSQNNESSQFYANGILTSPRYVVEYENIVYWFCKILWRMINIRFIW